MIRRTMKRDLAAEGYARFLTFSCYRRLPLFRNARIRDRFVERLTRVAAEHAVDVFAWVVMPEHVHLVVLPIDPTAITRFTHALKRPFALEILNRWRSLNAAILPQLAHGDGHRFWQTGGGHDRTPMGAELFEKIAYTHLNPARCGLVGQSTDYRWSSAAAYEGLQYVGPPIDFDSLPPFGREGFLGLKALDRTAPIRLRSRQFELALNRGVTYRNPY